jgi:hypothetical protein
VHAPIADCERDAAFGDQHARAARPFRFMPMNVPRGRLVDGQRHRVVPQRARTQQLPAPVAHLPVQPRKRIGEARVGWRPRHHKMPFRNHVDAGQQLLEVNVEVVGKGSRDMTLEQQDQSAAGDGE